MKIGYARVSTDEQNLDLQIDALTAVGCETIYTDEGISGISKERDGLTQALSAIGKGDILVVWKLDRLGRSLGFLCSLIERCRIPNYSVFHFRFILHLSIRFCSFREQTPYRPSENIAAFSRNINSLSTFSTGIYGIKQIYRYVIQIEKNATFLNCGYFPNLHI